MPQSTTNTPTTNEQSLSPLTGEGLGRGGGANTQNLANLGKTLQLAGIERPALVLEESALQHNIDWLNKNLPTGYMRRVADKSLAAPELLGHALQGLHTHRTMSFHLPLTQQVLQRHPDLDVLMGKPMPVGEAARFIASCANASQVCWLIDSVERLAQYRQLAEQGAALRVAFEVDIGLGRGGFASTQELKEAAASVGKLQLQGLMGYDAHVSTLPTLLGRGARAMAQSQSQLAAFAAALPAHARAIINTGGSTTNPLLPANGCANELTVGSAIVKPGDFDQPCNHALRPALFIATPILKRVPHGVPAHPRLSGWLRRFGIIGSEVAFTYGGKWMAQPVWPPGLKSSPFYGQSSNQQGWVLPKTLPADESNPAWLILRPTQSEAVIQQFGGVHLWRDGEIAAFWPAFAVDGPA